MANIQGFVGVPKRASCNRCSNPIFLAERISFGEKSYHRSCLKCARCGTQLTVGSFYETETDGEYCCETCPDEEIQLTQRRESSASSGSSRSSVSGAPPVVPIVVGLSRNVRSSKLLDRISFFESAPLSDEEKTSNLERKSRMSSFLKGTLEGSDLKQDKPPDLPTTPPPSVDKSLEINIRLDTAENSVVVLETLDVEDEFDKLVQDLDRDDDLAPEGKGSTQCIPDEVEQQHPTSTGNSMHNSLVLLSAVQDVEDSKSDDTTALLPAVEKESTEPTTSLEVVHTADETENSTVFEEATIIEPIMQLHATTDVKTDDEIATGIHLHNVLTNVDQNDVENPEEIVESEVSSSTPPPPSKPIPSVIESIVPEENERTDTNLLFNEPVANGGTKLLTDEPMASTDTNLLPNEPVTRAETKLLPEDPLANTELTLLPNEPVEDKKMEANVPSDNNDIEPLEGETKHLVEEVVETKPAEESSTYDKELYPSDLNPFGDNGDDEGEGNANGEKPPADKPVPTVRRVSTNPFGSEDEDDNTPQSPSAKPPRPPPPKVKTSSVVSRNPVPANPFGEDDDDDAPTDEPEIVPVVSKPSPRRTPVPTPRKAHAYNDSVSSFDNSLLSSSRLSSSNVSLASSMESGGPSSMVVQRRKKGKAPDVPVPLVGEVSPQPTVGSTVDKASNENLSISSGSGTLTTPRKKRPAPPPPPAPTSTSTPKQPQHAALAATTATGSLTRAPSHRLIALDASLIGEEHNPSHPVSDESVVYRRTIVPLVVDDDGPESPVHDSTNTTTSQRQWEKMKDNKEAQNRNRQSQSSPISESNGSSLDSGLSILANKSSQGKWKRRKGPAPALPMIAAPLPERKPIKMLPLKEIHQELQIIETQQQGLEKQGIVLEKMIRERCEGVEATDVDLDIRMQANSKEVEDLIMQLFELVNEKNELFRRQAELMYLRRMHRLEQEQADLEYEIRLLMAQPERNKTDSDKEKEEALIARLVEIVQLRNEVVECLEMDRIREAEEDLSIKQSIEERAASQHSKHGSSKKESSTNASSLPLTDAEKRDSSMKLSKKEKKKLKEAKKLVKSKKIDSEKDADETESSATKEKKKKRKFLF